MLIATQTPDFNDPPNLREETLALAGPMGGTLFDLFGNPILLRDLWPQVRKRFSMQSPAKLHSTGQTRRGRSELLSRLAIDLVLDRLADEGRGTQVQRRIDGQRLQLRQRILDRRRANGEENAKRLLLYCGNPELTAGQRVQALLELFLGHGQGAWDRVLRGPKRRAFHIGLRTLEAAQVHLRKLEHFDATATDRRLPTVLEALRDLYHLDLAGAPRSGRGGLRLGQIVLWAARWASAAFPREERVRALLAELLLLEARHAARWNWKGVQVHLSEQDRSLWDRELVREAGEILAGLDGLAGIGREQHRARVQWTLMAQPSWEQTDFSALTLMFRGLEARVGSPGVSLGTALAAGSMRPSAGLRVLEQSRLPLADDRYLAARGALLARLGEVPAALRDLRRAQRQTPFMGQARSLTRHIEALEEIDRNFDWGQSESALAS